MTEQPETGTPETETVEGSTTTEPTPEAGESLEARIARMEAALKKANHEAAKYRKQAETFEQAEAKRKEAELSEMEKLQKRLAETEAEANRLKLESLQRQAAEKAGIPLALAERLKGATLEELEADALALAETLPKSTKTPPTVAATNPGANADGKGETDAQRRARMYGSPANVFEPKSAEQHGGGVIFKTKE
jgi:hypothetical protein